MPSMPVGVLNRCPGRLGSRGRRLVRGCMAYCGWAVLSHAGFLAFVWIFLCALCSLILIPKKYAWILKGFMVHGEIG